MRPDVVLGLTVPIIILVALPALLQGICVVGALEQVGLALELLFAVGPAYRVVPLGRL